MKIHRNAARPLFLACMVFVFSCQLPTSPTSSMNTSTTPNSSSKAILLEPKNKFRNSVFDSWIKNPSQRFDTDGNMTIQSNAEPARITSLTDSPLSIQVSGQIVTASGNGTSFEGGTAGLVLIDAGGRMTFGASANTGSGGGEGGYGYYSVAFSIPIGEFPLDWGEISGLVSSSGYGTTTCVFGDNRYDVGQGNRGYPFTAGTLEGYPDGRDYVLEVKDLKSPLSIFYKAFTSRCISGPDYNDPVTSGHITFRIPGVVPEPPLPETCEDDILLPNDLDDLFGLLDSFNLDEDSGFSIQSTQLDNLKAFSLAKSKMFRRAQKLEGFGYPIEVLTDTSTRQTVPGPSNDLRLGQQDKVNTFLDEYFQYREQKRAAKINHQIVLDSLSNAFEDFKTYSQEYFDVDYLENYPGEARDISFLQYKTMADSTVDDIKYWLADPDTFSLLGASQTYSNLVNLYIFVSQKYINDELESLDPGIIDEYEYERIHPDKVHTPKQLVHYIQRKANRLKVRLKDRQSKIKEKVNPLIAEHESLESELQQHENSLISSEEEALQLDLEYADVFEDDFVNDDGFSIQSDGDDPIPDAGPPGWFAGRNSRISQMRNWTQRYYSKTNKKPNRNALRTRQKLISRGKQVVRQHKQALKQNQFKLRQAKNRASDLERQFDAANARGDYATAGKIQIKMNRTNSYIKKLELKQVNIRQNIQNAQNSLKRIRQGEKGVRNKASRCKQSPKEFRKPAETTDGKEAASDAPSWVKRHDQGKPYIGEDGKEFANRMMTSKYGENWSNFHSTGAGSEYSKIQKYGNRSFL